LKAGAEQAVKTAKDAAVKTWLGTGPVQHAQLAGAAGPDAFWSTYNASPGATYGPNVAQASYQAAKAFMPAPATAPIPGTTPVASTATTSTLPKVATTAPNPITSKPPSPTAKTENPYAKTNYDPKVAQLQKDLNDAGYNAGPVDGQMGPQTKAAADARKADQAKSGSSAAERSSTSTGSGSGSSGSSSSGHTTPSGQSYPDQDNAGHSYGSSGYGTGPRGY
jgi:hypothetical protein